VGCAAYDAGLGAVDFPVVKYLRIFSSRFGLSPRIASKSSTLLNGPYDSRIFSISAAVAGPIPGTYCNCSDVAVFRFTGFSGGFFLAPSGLAENRNTRQAARTRSR
jgi:hypothetical protein